MTAEEDRDPFALPHDRAALAHRYEHAEAKYEAIVARHRVDPSFDRAVEMMAVLNEMVSINTATIANSVRITEIMRSMSPGMAELVAAVDAARARHATAEAARIDAEIDRRVRGATGTLTVDG